MGALKTNPAYATLAYRRTIVHTMITYLKREYVGLDSDPKSKIICEEVLSVDREIPVEEIEQYVEELEREHHSLTLELGKFEFTRQDRERRHDHKQQPPQKKGHQGPR